MKKVYLFLISTAISFATLAQTKIKDGSVTGTPITPNASAILELESNSKGFLPPRVALSSNTDVTTIASPVPGLLVYNTGTAGLTHKGYVYWNGLEWSALSTSNLTAGAVATLNCADATMLPSTYTKDVPFTGTLTIPYTGGNGGVYAANMIGPINGLTATLASGKFNSGAGTLVYTITGTPTEGSPATTTFPVSIGSKSCDVTVGSGVALKVGEFVTAIYSVPAATANANTFNLGAYVTANSLPPLPLIDGLEMNLQGVNANFYDPRIYNRNSTNQVISYQTFATQVNENETSLNNSVPPNGFVQVDANNSVYWTASVAEVATTNLQVQISPTTYRWYEFKWWCMRMGTEIKIFLSVQRKA